ncbi:molecular chaperone protein, DnaJ family [Rhizobium etli CFN 42]|uniref:Molecular chaperone protein, DnaJ family n=2 Tax=Rhizobium etli TaxID=29449 RepID=Q2KBN6_RHIEC|nr:DnaJ C-terminal domain-containing protein [Rhizobium etli]ABC89750.1 molecular chaperone protein, DnaJ family [Rhizobium etli CFN 42]AGS20803.1 DnaJ family heat shock protein [Rhizobium etli bv. mimosae str. Mim1]ARQ09040.1 DnaJ family heat shock protein [Rhizobium etli]
MRDPYKILGVRRDAAADEIKAAWRNMAKAAHPDHNQDDPTATARFAEIGRAYETLRDPRKRSLFDNAVRMAEAKKQEQTIMQQRQAAREAAARAKAAQANAERVMEELARAAQKTAAEGSKQQAAAGEGAEEMVERIFGAQTRAAAGGQAQGRAQAQNQQYQQTPNQQTQGQAQAEAAKRGDGDATEAEEETGEASNNAGANLPLPLSILTSLVRRFTGAKDTGLEKAPDEVTTATVTIDDVLKSGWISASLPEGREIGFALPAGTTDGHEIRLKGQGFKLPGMQRGDAVVNIRIAPDPRFTVDGFDLHAVLPLSIENAVLGTETRIDGPAGPLDITVPAWSGSDKTIRIPGQGLPREDGSRGDLVVELRIILWEKPDDKITDLMRSMREGLFL